MVGVDGYLTTVIRLFDVMTTCICINCMLFVTLSVDTVSCCLARFCC